METIETTTKDAIGESDKAYWHDYLPFYEQILPRDTVGTIVEFGVDKGASIKWLLKRFPNAQIIGVDILPPQIGWPDDVRVRYTTLDQGREDMVAHFFREIPRPTLVIEDGSHIPLHQSICLRNGLAALAPGGVYILEDIHTSHPAHALYRKEFGILSSAGVRILDYLGLSFARKRRAWGQTSLSTLLGFEHLKRLGRKELTDSDLNCLSGPGTHFNRAELLALFRDIEEIRSYRRSRLPLFCWRCKRSRFNYNKLRCICGTELLSEADSMSIAVKKRWS